MSEQRLAPKCSAKAGRVNLHHSHPLLTFMMLVGLPFFIIICLGLCFFPPRQKTENQIASENRCQEQMFPDAVDII